MELTSGQTESDQNFQNNIPHQGQKHRRDHTADANFGIGHKIKSMAMIKTRHRRHLGHHIGLKIGLIKTAARVMLPWYTNTGINENTTPMPMEEPSIMEKIPSKLALAKRV